MRVVAFVAISTTAIAQAADWPLFGHDSARSGVSADRTLTRENVAKLRLRWRVVLGGIADSAPIVVGRQVFQTQKDGTTVALDVGDGRTLWRFTTHGPQITSSVPAYDDSTKTLYVPGVDGAIHKLDPASGRELTGDGFPARITLANETEKDASSLNVANGYLYAQTSGYIGDATPYVGHIVAIRLRDGETHVFNSLCSAQRGLIEPQSCDAQRAGMWSRAGVVVDSDPAMHGRIYAATGNGPFDASAGNYGDSILSLNAEATQLLGSLTPPTAADLEARDLDVGSSSPALLPRERKSSTPLLAVQGGKDSTLRLFDREHLGSPRAELQNIALGSELFSAPAVWTDPRGTTFVFLGLSDGVHAYRLTSDGGSSRLATVWDAVLNAGNQGSSPVVSNGIVVFALSGELVALDARNGRRLWSGVIGPTHWQSPAVADGFVFCSDNDGALSAFALPSAASGP